jgi:hypothetical protein
MPRRFPQPPHRGCRSVSTCTRVLGSVRAVRIAVLVALGRASGLLLVPGGVGSRLHRLHDLDMTGRAA